MQCKELPSLEVLDELFDYNPDSGVLTRKSSGRAVGSLNQGGYLSFGFKGRHLLVHRVVYKMYHRVEPGECVDHCCGDKTNNCIANLRSCSQTENKHNSWMQRDREHQERLRRIQENRTADLKAYAMVYDF